MSAESDAATEALNAALPGPKRVKGDAGEVEQHNLKDLMEVERYMLAKDAARTRRRGLPRPVKIIPDGTVC